MTFDLWPRNSIGFVLSPRYMFTLNIIKLSATVHQLSCTQASLPYLAMVKKPIIRSCDLNLWPMTLIFSVFRVVVKGHVRTEFHQAACSGSWVILLTEKKTWMKTMRSVARAKTDLADWSNPGTARRVALLLLPVLGRWNLNNKQPAIARVKILDIW